MQKGFEIKNDPEAIKRILSQLKIDKHLSKTFEGTAINGTLKGFYTNLALINGIVIGYVKIKGTYDLKTGCLKIKTIPSILFWLLILLSFFAGFTLLFIGIKNDSFEKFGSLVFVFMAIAISFAYFFESRSFYKNIHRINK